MTSDETVIEPTATPKPMRDRFFLVAGFVGAIAGLLASVAAAVGSGRVVSDFSWGATSSRSLSGHS